MLLVCRDRSRPVLIAFKSFLHTVNYLSLHEKPAVLPCLRIGFNIIWNVFKRILVLIIWSWNDLCHVNDDGPGRDKSRSDGLYCNRWICFDDVILNAPINSDNDFIFIGLGCWEKGCDPLLCQEGNLHTGHDSSLLDPCWFQ